MLLEVVESSVETMLLDEKSELIADELEMLELSSELTLLVGIVELVSERVTSDDDDGVLTKELLTTLETQEAS